jgi:hypothetical protein
LEDTLLDEECNDHGYVPFVVITIWSQDIFLIPK